MGAIYHMRVGSLRGHPDPFRTSVEGLRAHQSLMGCQHNIIKAIAAVQLYYCSWTRLSLCLACETTSEALVYLALSPIPGIHLPQAYLPISSEVHFCISNLSVSGF